VTDLSTITFGSNTDPYNKAAERGWDITDASQLTSSLELEADVVVVGTGAGGGTAAETLSKAGLSVILLEAGPLKTSSQFDMQERAAYRDLYQEGTGRGTKDGGMVILQGRSVGGSTTVNWTTSFRTPPETLKFWGEHMGVSGCSGEEMAPYFAHMEERLNIHKWPQAPNNNNAMLQRGAEQLGYPWATIHRNVRGCLNLGYCGLGCPVDAKQSMLVTTIPGALDNKAKLVHRARVVRILREGDVVKGVEAEALTPDVRGTTGQKIRVRATRTILAGGAINTPAVLLRSDAPDPHGRIGKRTFLHPATLTMAIYEELIDPYYGAPQSIYSDHFQWQNIHTGPIGFKLEVPPLQQHGQAQPHPVHGRPHARRLPRGEPGRGGRDQRQGAARPRLPDQRLPLGRRAPRLQRDARDAVRNRCQVRAARAQAGQALYVVERSQSRRR
jgi:hypothetical protein